MIYRVILSLGQHIIYVILNFNCNPSGSQGFLGCANLPEIISNHTTRRQNSLHFPTWSHIRNNLRVIILTTICEFPLEEFIVDQKLLTRWRGPMYYSTVPRLVRRSGFRSDSGTSMSSKVYKGIICIFAQPCPKV